MSASIIGFLGLFLLSLPSWSQSEGQKTLEFSEKVELIKKLATTEMLPRIERLELQSLLAGPAQYNSEKSNGIVFATRFSCEQQEAAIQVNCVYRYTTLSESSDGVLESLNKTIHFSFDRSENIRDLSFLGVELEITHN